MANQKRPSGILGLFPYFDAATVGGIQASSRLAWDALQPAAPGGGSVLFLFGREGSGARLGNEKTVVAAGRLRAAWLAWRERPVVQHIVVWHLSLCRLLPLFGVAEARTAVYLHGIEAWRELGWLDRRVLDRADLFLSNSDFTWTRFVELNRRFADRRHQTVALGWAAPTDGTYQPDPQPAVVMVSRLQQAEDYKGHRELIQAWPLVLRAHPDARLWVVGDGDLRPELEGLASRLLPAHAIRFWGRVSEEEKEELIGRSRCLALPSRGEGFGLVYLEAMRLGRPCLVGDADAGREVVRPPEAGLAVDPSRPEALAQAVVRLLSPGPEWDRWSRQARDLYESRYTAAHFQKRLLEALGLSDEGPRAES